MYLKLDLWSHYFSNIFYLLFISATLCSQSTLGRHQRFSSIQSLTSLDESRSSKLFPLFSIVRISNQPCTPELGGVSGTCYTKSQCRNSGGVESGSCASGFGVCCVVSATCDSVITHNNTNFRNRDFPEAFSPGGLEVCNTRIQKPNSNVCQLRLDFLSLKLAGPDVTAGSCMNDHFSINGVSGTVPSNLCGDLSGQHMYLDYGSSDRITLSLLTDGGAITQSRDWNIKIMYIECNSVSRAPDGCLQYFTSATGQVRMLGYPNAPHLAELDYTVCVRSEDGAGSIVWSHCQGEPADQVFLLTGDPLASGGTVTACTDFAKDYVLIMTDDTTKMNDRYCGHSITETAPFMVQSIAKPFIMRVKTDADETGDMMNTGFCLAFRQQPPRPG